MTEGARVFLERLGDAIENDEGEAEIIIASDSVIRVGEDGKRCRDEGGAEAVLIIRGPLEGRSRAVAKLLALIDS